MAVGFEAEGWLFSVSVRAGKVERSRAVKSAVDVIVVAVYSRHLLYF
jgi:hypothetical protein